SLPRRGQLFADKVVIAYALYTSALTYLHYETFTGGMRHLTTTTLDFVLLYFVASRGLLLKGAVRHVMVALVMAAIFLALVGAFEFGKRWLLYSAADGALGASTGTFGYLGRGDTLRALASTGQPIVLGFVMMVALLISCYAQRLVPPGGARILLWLTMAIGLIAAMSRGPWVGAAIGLFVVALASTTPLVNGIKLIAASLVAAVVLVMLPSGEKILNYLPWVGEIDSGNITFREVLWQQSLLVVEKNPWIGSVNYTSAPEFDVIRQGNGFVDIVNSYLGVVLSSGLTGLALYILLILVALLPNIKNTIVGKEINEESAFYSMALLGVLVASIITIWTVSSINQIAPLLTFVLGAGVANAWSRKQCATGPLPSRTSALDISNE
ncbi:MAG: O-antigen ligase family protein, partial [Methylophilaceae bacterium]|nr:O-antigen ligase family protein [Methylophilaceae bacterium]